MSLLCATVMRRRHLQLGCLLVLEADGNLMALTTGHLTAAADHWRKKHSAKTSRILSRRGKALLNALSEYSACNVYRNMTQHLANNVHTTCTTQADKPLGHQPGCSKFEPGWSLVGAWLEPGCCMHTNGWCHTFLNTWNMILLVACMSSGSGSLRFVGLCCCGIALCKFGDVEGICTGLTKGSRSL